MSCIYIYIVYSYISNVGDIMNIRNPIVVHTWIIYVIDVYVAQLHRFVSTVQNRGRLWKLNRVVYPWVLRWRLGWELWPQHGPWVLLGPWQARKTTSKAPGSLGQIPDSQEIRGRSMSSWDPQGMSDWDLTRNSFKAKGTSKSRAIEREAWALQHGLISWHSTWYCTEWRGCVHSALVFCTALSTCLLSTVPWILQTFSVQFD